MNVQQSFINFIFIDNSLEQKSNYMTITLQLSISISVIVSLKIAFKTI